MGKIARNLFNKFVQLKFSQLLKNFLVLGFILIFGLYIVLLARSYNLPSMEALQNYVPVQTTKLISADGKPIRDLYVEKREVIDIAEVPEDLRKALVFMEDRRFFEHPGIDIWGIFRAIFVKIGGGNIQGASTLTQQLARNMYIITIGRDKTISRKVDEAITAYNIEKTYTKSEIMELYLNSVFFGHQANGVQEAAIFYFGKEVKDLNLNESASIIGLLPAPNTYSPKNKKRIDTIFGYSKDFMDKQINQDFFIELGECVDVNIKLFHDCNKTQSVCDGDIEWSPDLGNGKWDKGEVQKKLDIDSIENHECYIEERELDNQYQCSTNKKCQWIASKNINLINKYTLTYIKGYPDKKDLDIRLKNIVFLDNNYNNIPITFSQNNSINNSISFEYVPVENSKSGILKISLITDAKIKYYRFKVSGFKGMKWDQGIGGGVAEDIGFIESSHSRLSFDRKNLVLNVMNQQGYFQDKSKIDEYNKNLFLPIVLSKNFKRDYGLASYFTEDVRKKLLKYRQQESYQKINYILPSLKGDSIMFDLKEWVGKKYKMRLDIDGYKADLYKDGLRVYCTLDTRIQKLTSDVFQDYMKKNQKDLYKIYTSSTNKGLLDSVILISKNRKKIELKSNYKTRFSSSLESQIINQEVKKWKNFNKSDEAIDLIIDSGKHIGENFYDCNQAQSICEGNQKWNSNMGNGIYDFGERFIDGNKQYNKGERFTDANKNNRYDPGEIFVDNKNNKYDSDGDIILKLRKEIDNMVKSSIDSLNYQKDFILDLLKNEKEIPSYLRKEFLIQGSVVVLDVKTGNIIAMIGGRQEKEYADFFNRSSRALRQPGSVFKPFVYMTALENYDNQHRPFSPNYKIQNQKFSIIDGPRDYQPENFDGKTGGEKTLRQGLKKSINLIAVRLISKIKNGPKKVKKVAENFGITSSIYPGEAIALGSSSVYPLEITSAYSAIANNGVLVKPNYIYKIDNNLGTTLKDIDIEDNYANPNEATIYLIRDMMRDVIRDGTGQKLRWKYKFYSPVAGKTGTTNKFTDAWFVGFTPQVCIGVWVGMDNPAVSIKKYGSDAALPIFGETITRIYGFGEYSLGDSRVRKLDKELDWNLPDKGIVERKICKESLKIANKYCKNKAGLIDEIFLEHHIPNDKCNIKSHISRYK